MTKKFKTIRGALNRMFDVEEMDAQKAGRPPDRVGARRRAINRMLPQFGVADSIRPDENPGDGIERMKSVETDTTKKQKLGEVLRWFERQHDWTVTSGGSSEFYRGKFQTKD